MDLKKRKISEGDIRTKMSLIYMDEMEKLRISFKELKIDTENNINTRMDNIDRRLNNLDKKIEEIRRIVQKEDELKELRDLIEKVLIKNAEKIERLENENEDLKVQLNLHKDESTDELKKESKYDFYC